MARNEPLADEATNEPSVDISAPKPRVRKPMGPGRGNFDRRLYVAVVGAVAGVPASHPSYKPLRTSAAATPPVSAQALRRSPVPEPQSEHPQPEQPVELSPRTVAPEKQFDWRAMRQLANLSANCALQRHESKRLFGHVESKIVGNERIHRGRRVAAGYPPVGLCPAADPLLRSRGVCRGDAMGTELHVA